MAVVGLTSNVDVRKGSLIWFTQQGGCRNISSLAELNNSPCWTIQLVSRGLAGWVNAGWGELIQRAGSVLVYSGDTVKFGADIAAARSVGIGVERIGGGGSASWSVLVSRVPVANYEVAFGSGVPVAGQVSVGQRPIPVQSPGGTYPATGAALPFPNVHGAGAPVSAGGELTSVVQQSLGKLTPLLIAGGLAMVVFLLSE